MQWQDFVTLSLITIILCIVIPPGPLLWISCFFLGAGAGIYRGKNPRVKK